MRRARQEEEVDEDQNEVLVRRNQMLKIRSDIVDALNEKTALYKLALRLAVELFGYDELLSGIFRNTPPEQLSQRETLMKIHHGISGFHFDAEDELLATRLRWVISEYIKSSNRVSSLHDTAHRLSIGTDAYRSIRTLPNH